MRLHHFLVMAGLSVEVVGAFVLAAEAIGLEKLAAWTATLSRVRAEMAGSQPRRGSTFLDPTRFIVGFSAAAGSAFGYWLSFRVPPWPTEASAKAAALAGGALGGCVLVLILYRGAIVTLRMGVQGLRRLEARVRLRAVAVLGFGLLFCGFLLQLVGTLVDGLMR